MNLPNSARYGRSRAAKLTKRSTHAAEIAEKAPCNYEGKDL